jgi:hypothetical protein
MDLEASSAAFLACNVSYKQDKDIAMMLLEQSYSCNKAMILVWSYLNRATDATTQQYQYNVT